MNGGIVAVMNVEVTFDMVDLRSVRYQHKPGCGNYTGSRQQGEEKCRNHFRFLNGATLDAWR